MKMTSFEVEALLKKHTSLKYDESKNKVICQLTKHEMPSTVEAIESYVKGKKYRKAAENSIDLNQLKPHIMPSTKRKHLHELFCFLTLRHLARTRQAVERHVSGKKYKRALARWTKCKETGEKFVPRGGKRSKAGGSDSDSFGGGGGHNWSDDSPNEDDTDDDDLEDLYPAEVFGGDSDDEDDDGGGGGGGSSEEEDDKAEENGPPLRTAPAQPTVETNDKSDEDSDYDLSVMDEAGDRAASNGSLEETSAAPEHKKKGKKKKKQAKKANAETSLDTSEQRAGGSTASSAKAEKRKGGVAVDGPKPKKKKKIKNC